MSNLEIPAPTLRIIRMALISGVLIFGIVVAYLTQSDGFVPDLEFGRVLRLVFLPLALGSFAGILAVRTAQSRAAPEKGGTFSIIGWALGESVALFGGVAWLIAGEMLLYLTGLGLMIVALLLSADPGGFLIAETIRGRGSVANPKGRFETLEVVPDPGSREPGDPGPRTRFLRDASRTIIVRNNSPDIGFDAGINPYRGCEHGCIYCYARPYHEYLGFSAGLDFETKILVKPNAAALLRKALEARSWKPEVVALSGVTDPYQPVERRLRITRACIEVLAEFRNPVVVVTKNHLVTRDIDLLADLAMHEAVLVNVSITTLDEKLQRTMEPRTAVPARRLAAVQALARAGIPVRVLVAPVIPAINDHEIPAILNAAADAGAHFAGYVMLRLPHGVKDLFADWLDRHYPARKGKVLGRLTEMRDGRLNATGFGERMFARGEMAGQIRALFEVARRKAGLAADPPVLSTAAFRRAAGCQLALF